MIRSLDIFDITGYFERQVDSTHVVSFWRIPLGDPHLMLIFFDDEGVAKTFADRWDKIPEMASLMTIEEYDHAMAQRKERKRLEVESNDAYQGIV